ncbi:recombinase family protein [uncultured Marinococcus sp.]|uniref:recombinase family protein n=1 Tax=uncultured Marinococcus sp. TaxID=487012 RepID=UPI00261019D6|nr:recombinase family protein [uncultured Marinococcus sp.]
MAGKHIGYARVSTNEQNLERQMQLLREAGCEKIFTDKDSGRQMKRKGWEEAKAFLREEDTLFIHDLNRLGRSMEGIKQEWEALTKMKVHIVVLNMPILDTRKYGKMEIVGQMVMNLLREVFAWMAEEQWKQRKEAQDQGIAIAKAQGKYKGRQTEFSPEGKHRDKYYMILNFLEQGYGQQEIAKRMNCGLSTVKRIKKRNDL